MIKFKAAGFTTNEIWSMCGATGIGTQGPNEYAKSGRPGVWTSLKRAETDMLRQLFPAEFGQIDREMVNEDTVVSVVIEGEAVDEEEIGRTPYTLEDANNDLFGSVPGDAQWQAQGEVVNVTPAAAPAATPAPAPMPDDELVITEATAKEFVTVAAALLESDTDTLKARMKELGYTSIPGKPDERVKAYRRLKEFPGTDDAATLPFDVEAPAGNGAYQE